MGFKLVLFGIVFLFLVLAGITGGVFIERLLPGSGGLQGNTVCFFAGFLYNPVIDIGGVNVPIPQLDDAAFGFIIAFAVVKFFMMKSSFRRKVLAFLIILAISLIIYKLVGLYLLSLAENIYGLTDCLESINLGIFVFNYDWLDPLYTLGFIFVFVAIIGGIWKLRKGGSNGG